VKTTRRQLLRTIFYGGLAIPAGTACYAAFEAGRVTVTRRDIPVPGLPPGFDGFRIAYLADIHHGPYTDVNFVQQIVRTANLLNPDLTCLGGDYVLREPRYIPECFDVLKDLRATHGLYGVLGNHDYWQSASATRRGFQSAKIEELTNAGVWLRRGNDRLRLVGVDDYWAGQPSLAAGLSGLGKNDCCVLLSHHPDFAEGIDDRRVGLVISGHMHGGQVVFPGMHPILTPSAYGVKYLRGLCQAPETQVYVSRGLGTTIAPFRLGSRAELTLITLKSSSVGS
jgi:uncharacterized protein